MGGESMEVLVAEGGWCRGLGFGSSGLLAPTKSPDAALAGALSESYSGELKSEPPVPLCNSNVLLFARFSAPAFAQFFCYGPRGFSLGEAKQRILYTS